MSLRLLPRRPLHTSTHFPRSRPRLTSQTRQPSTQSIRASSSSTTSFSTHTRISRLLARLPPSLHPYTTALLNAPISHLTSFLILHEITAIVPLVGLATTFHYAGWLPEAWVQGRWVREGVERFGRYFGRKGWFGFTPAKTASTSTNSSSLAGADSIPASVISTESAVESEHPATEAEVEEYVQGKWHAGEQGTRILVEVATAYAITKVLLPARILLSVWAAPWFARVVLGRFGGVLRGRGGGVKAGGVKGGGVGGVRSDAAGTGATGGGVIRNAKKVP
ncbi:hypothetical protein BKA65DRAFT_461354 [Rhexocercosporidium sp. MPI-PUGE-AT-0058]|nr:hypothetical protein BKA65DRAFT_461354 [Rhexocercosporidium sp. MPI-PUGE-AT-0058]